MPSLDIAALPEFDVFKVPTYDEALADNLALLKQLSPDYVPLEGDDRMLLLEAFSYREVDKQHKFVAQLKNLLLLYATSDALDVVAVDYGVARLDNEKDEVFRQRIANSLFGHSTAGSLEGYDFHARSVDSRIDDVHTFSQSAAHITVVITSFTDEISNELLVKVTEAVSDKKVRPLTDMVSVVQATKKPITITATITLNNLIDKAGVEENIYSNFATTMRIAQSLTYSEIINKLHINGVYKVVLMGQEKDVGIVCLESEIIIIESVVLTFSEVDNG